MKSLNIQNQNRASQTGFTIIELVVVILLLGILAATALPRFIDVTSEAHDAVVDAVEGGLSTAHALYHAEYVGKGNVGTSVSSYPSVAASATTGYPNVASNSDCSTAFDNMLQGGHPSVVAGSSAVDVVGNLPTDFSGASEPLTSEFVAFYLTTTQACSYVYTADVSSFAAVTAKVITIDTDGDVSRSTF